MITTAVEGSCRLCFSPEGRNVERERDRNRLLLYFFKLLQQKRTFSHCNNSPLLPLKGLFCDAWAHFGGELRRKKVKEKM